VARGGLAESRMPERKLGPPIERPASSPRQAREDDATPPGKPSLFERMTGTGRARRNGHDGEMGITGGALRTAEPPLATSSGLGTARPETQLRAESPTVTTSTPSMAGDMRKPATTAAEPFLDGFAPSTRATGGTEDPLDIPAFLRRQAN
jgi:hypothetical protein